RQGRPLAQLRLALMTQPRVGVFPVGLRGRLFTLHLDELHRAYMTQDTKPRAFHARIFARRLTVQQVFLLPDREFRFAAECERMRVDRNGSVLSLLLIRLSAEHSTAADVHFLARVLEGRLRIT